MVTQLNGEIMGHFHEVSCCVDAPHDFAVKAKYALEMLLMPLGLKPRWVQRDDLLNKGIYYGSTSESLEPGILRFHLHAQTLSYFQSRSPYSLSNIIWRTWDDERWPVLFGSFSKETDDLIASSFFWLSGWQEYTVTERDFHGRFPFSASLPAKLSLEGLPFVDIYREQVARILQSAGFPIKRREWGGKAWAFCPTHDIDYIKKWRPGMVYREIVQYFLANKLRRSFLQRTGRLGAFTLDWLKPGDVFRKSLHRMIDETEVRGGTGTYFFKTDAHGPRDVFYSISDPFVKRTIARLHEADFEVGLHPSYYAYNHSGYLQKEKEQLEAVSKRSTSSVRQHYLRFEPLTSRLHERNGFFIDSTIAFADKEGFRRGTCLPFKVFDIAGNSALELWEMPLCLMDGTLFNYRGLSLDDAIKKTSEHIQWCKRFGGVCVGLWHNMLWDELDFPNWGAHFLESLDMALHEEAFIGSLHTALSGYLGSQV